ncbi:DNA topoisomerase IB [Salinibacterium sp. M195]|uniref:DNA topoisomerase IB n=1 Tax=Salinibacterium sp. M195 TaxID=2583374 RepID=UPI001C635FFD|nr:DNA topoisomerase IB [Salinibacterium sp. M195]QYH35304.1 DNA topoisomerase IB [Salinibacterium sp. M195]
MPRLRRSNTTGRGFSRVRSGRGFGYRDPDGATVAATDLKSRFASLGIPPAWTDVWICPYENGHVLATGFDEAGRRQYIYHPAWRERQDRVKFDRALELAAVLPGARGVVTRTLRSSDDPRERTLAAAFRMLDTGSLRVGSERYAEAHGSHGLSTLLCDHVTVVGDRVQLCFPAKSGQQWESEIVDADLAEFIRRRLRSAPDASVLSWREGRERRSLTAADINDYVRERTGGDFTAKDFRTLRGTIAAASSLAVSAAGVAAGGTAAGAAGVGVAGRGAAGRGAPQSQRARSRAIREAMEAAAEVLGNTPAIAKKSYVDPRIVDLFSAGETINPQRLASAESEVRELLARNT